MNDITKRRLSQLYKLKNTEYTLDDISFNDLNLDSVFEKINYTSSSLGEEVLYSMLRQPLLNNEELLKREELINHFYENVSLREKNIKGLNDLSKLKKYSVFEYLYHLKTVKSIGFLQKYLALILMIISILIIPLNVSTGIILLVISFIANTLRYFKIKDNINPYMISISYILKTISYGKKLEGYDVDSYNKIKKIRNYSPFLGTISGSTVHGGSGNPLDIILDFFKMGFHFDIILFYSLINKIIENETSIEKYITSIGLIDAYLSIGKYRKCIEGKWCIPNIKDTDESYLKIIDLRHPLLENAVGNDIDINKSVLLTGSNASGKSTFLRSVAINCILAQSIHTVTASSYEAPIYRVITSMSIQDNILSHDSFYMAEVKALKRIIDLVNKDNEYKILSVVDELLRGTNTKERIASTTKILEFLSNRALSFAATHDIELTSLLKNSYSNYHFSEDILDDDIVFNYKLNEGPASTYNAIKLLSLMGFPKNIIEDANEMIEKSLF